MAQKTIKVGAGEVALDDASTVVAYVDVFTETGAVDGMVYCGLGQFVGGQRIEAARVVDVVHLRMSPIMARRMAHALLEDAATAERQLAEAVKPPN